MIFAYFGPETVLPLTSIFAAAAGVVLMFGRQAKLICKFGYRTLVGMVRNRGEASTQPLPRAGRHIVDRSSLHVGSEAQATPVQS